jgi:hypothetical protein
VVTDVELGTRAVAHQVLGSCSPDLQVSVGSPGGLAGFGKQNSGKDLKFR